MKKILFRLWTNTSKSIKKSKSNNIRDIYALLGASRSTVYKWRYNTTVTQSKDYFKHSFIKKAGELFSLSHAETEALANKAGLSLYSIKLDPRSYSPFQLSSKNTVDKHIHIKENLNTDFSPAENFINTNFIKHFNALLSTYSGKKNELCEAALVSDRMFRHIKSGKYLRKEPILALLITMGLSLEDIQKALKKAGFILSRSMPNDIVIIWMLENELSNHKGAKRLYRINELLDSLELPLLMTRWKD